MYDVIIVGAGVTGAFIARELSKYQLKICLVEKESDVAMGTSKANSAIIHAGFDSKPGTLKAALNVRGNKLMKQVAEDLHVPFQQIGSLVLCFTEEDIAELVKLRERGVENGVEGLEIVYRERLQQMEPHISPNAVAALSAPTGGIICPYELTLHAAENAVENGVELKRNHAVTAIAFEDDHFNVSTTQEILKSRYIVNAAGLYSDEISKMAGDESYSLHPRKGEYLLFDKKYGNLVNHVIFQLPSEKGKGILVTPTVDGNLLAGPTADEVPDKEDLSTSSDGLAQVLQVGSLSVDKLDPRGVITSFSGLRAASDKGDFIIAPSPINKKLIHAAGIESPGLTSAPAIGEMVVEILKESGLEVLPNINFNPVLTVSMPTRAMDIEEFNRCIAQNRAYGKIVCRCEKITEGEIIASIHRPIGAEDLDGVKRRTRAGMGRCQGGFCSPRILEILSNERGVPMEEITKSGGESKILVGRTK